jgi:hypothetical protein
VGSTLVGDLCVGLQSEIRRHEDELSKAQQRDTQTRTALQEKIDALKQERDASIESMSVEFRAKFLAGLDAVISENLLELQARIISDGAQVTLDSFCHHTSSIGMNVIETPGVSLAGLDIELFDPRSAGTHLHGHECVGLASADESVLPLTGYLLDDPELARVLGHQAMVSLNASVLALQHTTLRDEGYRLPMTNIPASAPSAVPFPPCCGRVVFAVHPVFGAFFRLLLPVVSQRDGGTDMVPVCFRRRWLPLPDVKSDGRSDAETVVASLMGTSVPRAGGRALDAVGSAEGTLVGAGAESLPREHGTIIPTGGSLTARETSEFVFVLPFRAVWFERLPSLLRSLSRVPILANGSASLIISPADLQLPNDLPVLERLTNTLKAAAPLLGYPVRLLEARPSKDAANAFQRAKAVAAVSGKRMLVDAEPVLTPSAASSEREMSASLAHAQWTSALLTALEAITSPRARVVVLDASASRVPRNVGLKVRASVVPGHSVLAPVMTAIQQEVSGADDEAEWESTLGLRERDTASLDPTGGLLGTETPNATTSSFWEEWMSAGQAPRRTSILLRGRSLQAVGEAELPGPSVGDHLPEDDSMDDDETAHLKDLPLANDGDALETTNTLDEEDPVLVDAAGATLVTATLMDRHTSIAGSRGDLGMGMMVALLVSKDEPLQQQEFLIPESDECVLRRVLYSLASQMGFSVGRIPMEMLVVEATSYRSTPETLPCHCAFGPVSDAPSLPHCARSYLRSLSHDPDDKARVGCGLTQWMAAHKMMVPQEEGEDLHYAPARTVTDTVSTFDPSYGLEIIAKSTHSSNLPQTTAILSFELSLRAFQCSDCY